MTEFIPCSTRVRTQQYHPRTNRVQSTATIDPAVEARNEKQLRKVSFQKTDAFQNPNYELHQQ